MVDTKSPGDKTLSVPTKTLTLKPRVETGTVRQSFSHGRTKQVVVEKRGKRRVGGDGARDRNAHAPEPVVAKAAPAKAAPLARPAPPAAPRSGSGVVLRTLTEDERSARASALADAKVRESKSAGWPKRKPSAATARKASSRPSARPPKPAARPRKNATAMEEEAKRKAELEAKKRFGEAEAKTAAATPANAPRAVRRARPARVPPARARRRRRRLRRGRRSAPDPPRPRRRRPPRRAPEDHPQAGARKSSAAA